jgi:hypothetical protein
VTEPGEVTEDLPRLFTVRIWNEVCADGIEHRGQVRDVTNGAFCSFRTWPELTSFLADHLGAIPSDPPSKDNSLARSAQDERDAPTPRRNHGQ